MLNRKQRIADQKIENDRKKEQKTNKAKKKAGDGEKHVNGVQSTLEKMLDSSSKQTDVSDAAGFEDDDMLSVVKRRRHLAAQAAEEKKKRDAE